MTITLSESRDITIDQVLPLYIANEWSAANKPDLLLLALINSHSLITAWEGDFQSDASLQILETSVKLFGELYEKDMEIKYLDDSKDIFPTKEEVTLLEEGLKKIGKG